MREREAELEALGVATVVVTFDDDFMARAYVADTKLAWPLLIDTERGLYRAYGMLRGRAWDLYGPAALWAYLKLFARGRGMRKPGSDVTQLGGDVLIDPEGIVRLHKIGNGPADRPSPDTLLQVVRDVAAQSPRG